jgi:phosphate transport system substrate-binding protein
LNKEAPSPVFESLASSLHDNEKDDSMRIMSLWLALVFSGAAMAADNAPDAGLGERPHMRREPGAASESAPVANPNIVRVDAGQALYPITRAITEAYPKSSAAAAKAIINVSRQGGGLSRLCDKHADMAEIARPVTETDLAPCKKNGLSLIALPVAMDALVVIVNPQNPASRLKLDDLRKMWADASQDSVRRWEQVDAGLLAQPLKLYGPENRSASAELFSTALFGKANQLRTDISASAEDGILAQGVARDVAGIGYVGYPYYLEQRNRLKALAIETSAGKVVPPSAETIANGSYQPFTRALQLYVSTQALQRPEVMAYVDYYLRQASRTAQALKYVALPDAEYAKNLDGLHKLNPKP